MEIKNYFAQDAQGNIMPSANCYLYLPGTTTLATGLVDDNGAPISNPFIASGMGQITFGAPNGVYDLRVTLGARDWTIKVQCADIAQAMDVMDSILGSHAENPTTRNNGQSLEPGDETWNSSDKQPYWWSGTAWVALNSGAQQLEERLAAKTGSGQIGWERGPVGLAQIKDVLAKLNTLEVSPWEFADLTTNRVNPLDPYTWNWSAAFQAMCNAHLRISVDGRYNLPAKVTLRPGAVLVGRGNMISAIKGPTSGPAFELLNPNGVTLVESPKFYDFTLECGTGSGIRLNSKTGGFTDNATTQSYMMRPVVDGVIFVGTITAGNFALDFNKCFNGSVIRNRFTGFDCAVDFLGCDLSVIGELPNRFMSNNIHARIRSAGTFGSGTRLVGNDMIHAKVNAVVSSDRDFTLGKNYFEQTAADPQLAALFDIEAGLHVDISGNRVDAAAAQAVTWLKVTGDFYSLAVHDNHTSGPTWGGAVFNGGSGSRYHASTINRQIITHSGNASEAGFPFNTIPDDMNVPGRFKSAWHMYPGVGGLAAGGNPLVRVVNNRFVMPYSAANYYRFTKGGEPITGNVHVYIKASAANPGELLVCQRRDGLSPVATIKQALTATPTWYQVFTNVAVNDLNMYFLNSADGQQDIYLHELVVDYA